MLLSRSCARSLLRLNDAGCHLLTRRLPFRRSVMTDSHVDGSTKWSSNDGRFRRQESTFRDSISSEQGAKFAPALNRYHLITAMACPWAHRTMIVRKLKGIDKVPGLLPLHTVDSFLGSEGWSFVPYEDPPNIGIPGTGIKIPGQESKKRIRELYHEADPNYSARCTVPIIWDNELKTIVNNESSEIIRMLNTCFDDFIDPHYRGLTYFPDNDEKLKKEIEDFHSWVYPNINNGVYKSGFASKQDAYEEAVKPLFESLDRVEKMLSDGREFVLGGKLTEADIRLFTTIIRFDPVYVTHFKCNISSIRLGYPKIERWMQNLYFKGPNAAAFKDTTDFDSIKAHYFQSHAQINPTRIVPVGPLPHIRPLS